MWHLTPEYASPEQIKGESITTQSDIYSLGVLLYEIISGEPPYRFTNTTPLGISKSIDETNIVKPSERIKQTTKSELRSEQNKNVFGFRLVLRKMRRQPIQ